MQRGTNLGRLGGYNQAVVLESIRRAVDGVSRVELAASTGLSPQTISKGYYWAGRAAVAAGRSDAANA